MELGKPEPVILSEAKNLRSYGIHQTERFSEECVGRKQTTVILRFAQNDTAPQGKERKWASLNSRISNFQFPVISFHFPVSSFQFLISTFYLLFSAFGFLVSARAADPGKAEALIEAGHWKRARAIVEPRVAANPRDSQAVWLLSRIKLAFGDLDGALVPAQQAVALEDGNSDFHLQQAEVYGQMAARASMFAAAGLARKFKGELDASLARNPKNLDALDALMQYSYQAPGLMGGDKGKARSIADQLVQLSPVHGHLAQAELAREAKDEAKVEESLRQAVKADPKNYEAQTALAGFYTHLPRRNTEEAEKHAREALRLDPGRAKAYSILATVLALERRWNELEAVLSASEKAVPDDLAPYFHSTNAVLEVGVELQRGEAYVRKYLGQEPEGEEPDAAHAHRLLGLVLEKQGRNQQAISELEIAVQMNPRFKEAKEDLKRVKAGSR
ncbi:MAG: tetratricopeptide repeat protein [Terriglobia bacterium]|jgi:tetratricopeptide (TPR) repeat protein